MPSENIHSFLSFWAGRFPERPALWCDGEAMSWSELDRRSDGIAAGLQNLGIGRGDIIGILLHNGFPFVEAMFGAFKAGAAVTMLNTRSTAREMVHPVVDTRLRLVVTEPSLLPLLADARQTADFHVFSTGAAEAAAPLSDLRLDPARFEKVSVAGEDTALICYSSGTTGTPKGAMLAHRNIVAAAVMRSLPLGQTFNDRSMVALPLCYTGGTAILIRDGIIPGSTTYLPRVGDAEQCLELISDERISVFASVPVILERLMAHKDFQTADMSSLRYIVSAGASCNPQMLSTWLERGVEICQGYGQTESGGSFATLLFADEARRKFGFAGRALPNMDIEIRGDNNEVVAAGVPGDIWLRGPSIMKGYFNDPVQTAEALVDGWLKTGDVGLVDEEGYLKVLDRSKDMLISGGLNVYPAEIERALSHVAGLEEFAVIGIPDPKWGEIPVLVISSLKGVSLAELRKVCETELADYKRPKYFIGLGGSLPRTASGKIRKVELREQLRVLPADALPLKVN